MQGVTVKQEIIEREIDKTTFVAVFIGVAISIILAIFTIAKCVRTDNIGLVIPVIIAAVAMIGYARTMWKAYNNTWPEYVVEVSDSVHINQFLEKYDVVEKEDGNVYRVRETENCVVRLRGK